MAIVNKVDFKLKVDINVSIKYQILSYCFFNDISISSADLKCLAELGKQKEIELTIFCNNVTELGIFKSPQSARNAIAKASKKNLIVKIGKNKKKILLNESINVQTKGNVLLDYKILGLETKAS